MATKDKNDWNPGAYSRFRGLRLQPALDLLASVTDLPAGDIIDLGCGNGAVGPALRSRFPDRALIGVDTSPSMLEQAQTTQAYRAVELADIADWRPKTPPALIFSNAALHWLGDHETLYPKLAKMLAGSGSLAFQVPQQNDAPSHRGWHEAMIKLFPKQEAVVTPGILTAPDYFEILSPLGAVRMWQTEYLQQLDASDDGHPVRCFTQSTFGRPFLEKLPPHQQSQLLAELDTAMTLAYPLRADGSVLFGFRRLFLVFTA